MRGQDLSTSRLRRASLRATGFAVVSFIAACEPQQSSIDSKVPVQVQPVGPVGLELSGVIAVAQTRSGSIVVGDRGLPGLWVIREDGSASRLGRAGSGPGEFEALTRVQMCRDGSLVAYDFAQARLHFYSEDAFQQQLQLPPSLVTGDLVGCSSRDSIVFSRLPDQVPGVGLHTVPLTLFTYTPADGSVRWLATLRGTEMFFSEGYQAFYERPYGLHTLVGFGRFGVVFAENSRIQAFRILQDGSTSPFFLLPHNSQRVRWSDRSLYIRDRVAEEPDSSARIVLRGVLNEVPWANSVPPIDRLIVSSTGETWLRRTPVGESVGAEWLIIDSLGQLSGSMLLPRRFRVMFVDSTQVLGVEDLTSGEERLARAKRRP